MDLCPFFKPIIRHFKSVCPTQSQLQPIILTSNHQMIERTFRCLSFSQVVGWSHFQISTVSVSLDCHRPRNVIYFLKATYDQQLSDFHFSKLYFSVYSKQTEWLHKQSLNASRNLFGFPPELNRQANHSEQVKSWVEKNLLSHQILAENDSKLYSQSVPSLRIFWALRVYFIGIFMCSPANRSKN